MATTDASATHVPVAEAKARFSEMVRRAGTGEEIVITSHGRPVARMLAPVQGDRLTGDALVEAVLDTRRALAGKVTRAEIVEWIAEGRR